MKERDEKGWGGVMMIKSRRGESKGDAVEQEQRVACVCVPSDLPRNTIKNEFECTECIFYECRSYVNDYVINYIWYVGVFNTIGLVFHVCHSVCYRRRAHETIGRE